MFNNCNGDTTADRLSENVYVEIVEQPAPKTFRFRYQCEGRSAGSIPGVNSTAEKKTFPSIRVIGYSGPAVIVVSCVTKDKPYRPHPHNLVGKDVGDKGVLTVHFDAKSTVTFNNLGIQCVRRNEVEKSLNLRESLRIDPFRTGYGHRSKIKDLDLNAVRLCFQTYLKKEKLVPLKPIVSQPIYDKKSNTDLIIVDLSDTASVATGGKKIIVLCEKVVKEDISVRFYEEIDGVIVWEAYGEFSHKNVHRQTAISFKTPAYKIKDIEHSVNVFVQLQRPSDKMTSEPLHFQFTPDPNEILIKRKRRRIAENNGTQELFNYLAENEKLLEQNFAQYRSTANNNNNNNNNGQELNPTYFLKPKIESGGSNPVYTSQSNFNQEPPQCYGYLGYNYPAQQVAHQSQQQIDINPMPNCSTAVQSHFQTSACNNWNIPRNTMLEKLPSTLAGGSHYNNQQQYTRFTSQYTNNNIASMHRPEELPALNIGHSNTYSNNFNILPATIQTCPNEDIDNMTDSFSKLL